MWHGVKFQSKFLPYWQTGSTLGRQKTLFHNALSFMGQVFQKIFKDLHGSWTATFIYGDFAYPMRIHLQAPYRQGNLSGDQINYKEAMREVRETVGWPFAEVKTCLNLLTSKLSLKLI